MRTRPKHIALFGNFGSNNLGNEASLKAMLDFIRRARPHTKVTCVCYGPDRARAEHDVPAIPIKLALPEIWWFAIVNRLLAGLPLRLTDFVRALYLARKFDLFIVPGTGILDDFSERWQGLPFDLFKWSVAAKLNRRPFALVSVGAGPIHHPVSRWLMVLAARLAIYRSYRDDISKNFVRTVGLLTQDDLVFPDLVFNLRAPNSPHSGIQNGRSPVIGVGVMDYYGWDSGSKRRSQIHETYVGGLTQFICWLLEHGYRVRLLLGELSDKQSFDEVVQRVTLQCGSRAAALLLAEPAHSLEDLMYQIGETELIVATRFHNIVAALMMGRSAISVGYADKNSVLLAEVGLGAFCQTIEEFDAERLIAQFEEVFHGRDQFSDRIRNAMPEFRRRLERQEAYLLENLL
ncbi:polysaccharide pyruvyl transferase family protein [Bradyrhizobium erythrophlei]|uniref:Polysaccharide pyruvyl transferase family protein WcaK n=1 Tax=Bradyrhizobium erythrophlei TaxID=1437360 RepID=A0A1M7SPP6_9BRAD|nr:polysaccharide pyruvyl transferase family protein [Bradyrhizobium erythrophlei]SHN60507.1 Polysaccharide pyruvyl transferase family protein WcaK [Bradyrhizobium erythrophlei]